MLYATAAAFFIFVIAFFYWYNAPSIAYIQTLNQVKSSDLFNPAAHKQHELLNTCHWPIFDPNERSLEPFLVKKSKPTCKPKTPLYIDFNPRTGVVRADLLLAQLHATCLVVDLTAKSNSIGQLNKRFELEIGQPAQVPYSVFLVDCTNENGTIYRNTYYNFVAKNTTVPSSPLLPSVAVLVIDSVSRNSAFRELPDTVDFIKKNEFADFTMYNKMADSTKENIDAIFKGLNDDDSILQNFKARGCSTMQNTEVFTPSDLDFETSILRELDRGSTSDNCTIDGMYLPHKTINQWSQFSIQHSQRCHFSTVLLEISDDTNELGFLDRQLRTSLESMKANEVFKTSVVIIVGANGVPYDSYGSTVAGRVEERNPLLWIHLPKEFRTEYTQQTKILKGNQKRLISNPDLFETILQLSDPEGVKKVPRVHLNADELDLRTSRRQGVSMLDILSIHYRSCSEALIPYHFCLCMDEKEYKTEGLNSTSDMFITVAEEVRTTVLSSPDTKCFDEVTSVEAYNNLQVFTLNDMVLKGVRNIRQWRTLRNKKFQGQNVEFLKMVSRGYAHRKKIHSKPYFAQFMSLYRYYQDDDRFEQAGDFAIHSTNEHCYAASLNRYCEMCFDSLLVS